MWRDSVFFKVLLAIDEGLAAETKSKRCGQCGDVLDVSNYARKARGVEDTGEFAVRLSFCCRADGCRRRATPPSVRFLGRKVYVGMVVILSSFREEILKELFPCRRTLSRWSGYWAQALAETHCFWKARRALFPPGFDAGGTPQAIVEFYEQRFPEHPAAESYLRFFSPLSQS